MGVCDGVSEFDAKINEDAINESASTYAARFLLNLIIISSLKMSRHKSSFSREIRLNLGQSDTA